MEISSTYSPGDGSRPETVSVDKCKKELKRLEKYFSKVQQKLVLNFHACEGSNRDLTVEELEIR